MSDNTSPIHKLLHENLPLFIIIGIFAALVKIFSVTEPDSNITFLTILSSILIILLLLVFCIHAGFSIYSNIKKQIEQGLFSTFSLKNTSDITHFIADLGLIVITVVIVLIIYTMITILKSQFIIELQILLFFIDIVLSIAISMIVAIHIIKKVDNVSSLFQIFIMTTAWSFAIYSFLSSPFTEYNYLKSPYYAAPSLFPE